MLKKYFRYFSLNKIIKINLIDFFLLFFNVTTRKCKVSCVAHITFLLGGAVLTSYKINPQNQTFPGDYVFRCPPESYNKAIITNQQTLGKS